MLDCKLNRSLVPALLFSFVIPYIACRPDKRIAHEFRERKIFAKEPEDSSNYKHIKYDFYSNKTGRLFERKLALARDTVCNCEFQVYYDNTFTIFDVDTNITLSLDSVVDINSFVALSQFSFSKDQRHVYYFHPNSDGGIRVIVENADPQSFRELSDYCWGIDKNYVFYKDEYLTGLDLNQLQVLHWPDTSEHFVAYVKDEKLVFYESNRVDGADAKTFKVISGKKWNAEDKNAKYENGNRLY